MSLIIHAPNVHQGGGRTLLAALLEAAAGRPDALAIVDERLLLAAPALPAERTFRIAPTLAGRLHAELLLRRLAQPGGTVLCFGNLPPLLAVRGRVVVFLQNRYLLDGTPGAGFPLRARARIALERLWLRLRIGAADTLAVQTPSMARAAKAALGVASVAVLPFLADAAGYTRRAPPATAAGARKFDFLYVASGEPHKNHQALVAAWEALAAEGLFPTLCLTLSRERHSALCALIDAARARSRLRIHNVDAANVEELARLYGDSAALIYPSTMESLGLPLIEARAAGLRVLAPESDYVRDVLDPEESFDPGSALSIARAVKRFLGLAEAPLPLTNAATFLDRIVAAPGPDENPHR